MNLNELLSDVIALSEARSGDKRVAVEFARGTLPTITCRPQQLNLVFSSLLSNAIEACHQTGAREAREARGSPVGHRGPHGRNSLAFWPRASMS